jgi:hypothetical protein
MANTIKIPAAIAKIAGHQAAPKIPTRFFKAMTQTEYGQLKFNRKAPAPPVK